MKLAHVKIGLTLAAGLAIAVTFAVAPAANASCARPPVRSPHAFVGTVVDTSEEDRIATVITDSGRRVTVLGTQDTSWFSESVSSTDRRYALGGRYEFHPTNAASPYQDNACTATRQLAGPHLQPLRPREEFLPGWLPVDEQAGPVGYFIFFGPVAAGALALALLARWGRRRLLYRRALTAADADLCRRAGEAYLKEFRKQLARRHSLRPSSVRRGGMSGRGGA